MVDGKDDMLRAEAILAGMAKPPREVLDLAANLRKSLRFGLARKLLEQLARHREVTTNSDLRLEVGQKLALCTYKDPDLPLDTKLDDALAILRQVDDLAKTIDQETLGLAGAIYKRKWELDGRERHLETSYEFYSRGYQQGVTSDYGYTAVNAAFVLDLLTDFDSPEEAGAPPDASVNQRRSEAQTIRKAIVNALPPLAEQSPNEWLSNTWWFLVTLGEAYFGLRDYTNAKLWLTRAAALDGVPEWERETTARQLARLLILSERDSSLSPPNSESEGRKVLEEFLGNDTSVESVLRGKIGLALSGGGFRASLYHIGVLARLAELDLLRHVEYLSCVSGGSIVGAHYYLEVRKLLQSKPDADITRNDYVEIVQRLCSNFLEGVQRNIRTRVAAEWWTNVKMVFLPDYSRTQRAGELYEKEIYSRVDDGEGRAPRWLNELKITPMGETPEFSPKTQNWRRSAKVPILVLNATSLNTGHNWQFTASWMGEPPAGVDSRVDANYRLRRMYYRQAPPPHHRMRLGYAVAASACVPGIFEPLSLAGLYERLPPEADSKVRPIVRLVDGGVYDNQGTAALLEQGCSVLLVSDASGQMDHEDVPATGILGVPLRSNSILQARIRVSQHSELESRRRGGTLKGLLFVHLKSDLDVQLVDWIDCQEPSPTTSNGVLTRYGIQKRVQRKLAAVRTDLDSFSEVEAYALMTSGYLMTETAVRDNTLGFPVYDAPRSKWPFLNVEPIMRQSSLKIPVAYWLDRQLGAASKIAFKVWMLQRRLQFLAALILIVVASFVVYNWRQLLDTELFRIAPTGADLLNSGISIALALGGLGLIGKVVNYRKTAREIVLGIFMATIGFVLARIHLHVFDRLFLRQGRIGRLLKHMRTEAIDHQRGKENLLVTPQSKHRI